MTIQEPLGQVWLRAGPGVSYGALMDRGYVAVRLLNTADYLVLCNHVRVTGSDHSGYFYHPLKIAELPMLEELPKEGE